MKRLLLGVGVLLLCINIGKAEKFKKADYLELMSMKVISNSNGEFIKATNSSTLKYIVAFSTNNSKLSSRYNKVFFRSIYKRYQFPYLIEETQYA